MRLITFDQPHSNIFRAGEPFSCRRRTGVSAQNYWLDIPSTVGAGWTDNLDGTYTSIGSVGSLTQIVNGLVSGKTYQLQFTVAGTYLLTGLDQYLGSAVIDNSSAANATVTVDIVAGTDNKDLVFDVAALNNFIGTISAISLRLKYS